MPNGRQCLSTNVKQAKNIDILHDHNTHLPGEKAELNFAETLSRVLNSKHLGGSKNHDNQKTNIFHLGIIAKLSLLDLANVLSNTH